MPNAPLTHDSGKLRKFIFSFSRISHFSLIIAVDSNPQRYIAYANEYRIPAAFHRLSPWTPAGWRSTSQGADGGAAENPDISPKNLDLNRFCCTLLALLGLWLMSLKLSYGISMGGSEASLHWMPVEQKSGRPLESIQLSMVLGSDKCRLASATDSVDTRTCSRGWARTWDVSGAPKYVESSFRIVGVIQNCYVPSVLNGAYNTNVALHYTTLWGENTTYVLASLGPLNVTTSGCPYCAENNK